MGHAMPPELAWSNEKEDPNKLKKDIIFPPLPSWQGNSIKPYGKHTCIFTSRQICLGSYRRSDEGQFKTTRMVLIWWTWNICMEYIEHMMNMEHTDLMNMNTCFRSHSAVKRIKQAWVGATLAYIPLLTERVILAGSGAWTEPQAIGLPTLVRTEFPGFRCCSKLWLLLLNEE